MTETVPMSGWPGTDASGRIEPNALSRHLGPGHSVRFSATAPNISASYRLIGEVNVARLKDAVAAVARRHEILRTTYRVDADGRLQPVTDVEAMPGWTEHDLTALPEQARELRLKVLTQRDLGQSFDLITHAPLRVTLIRTGPTERMMLLAAHPIAWDDASWRVFLADLTLAYTDPSQYAEQPTVAQCAQSANGTADSRYRRVLPADLPEPLELPGPNGSVVARTSRAGLCSRPLSADTVTGVAELARTLAARPYDVLVAAVSALIARCTQTNDFLILSPLVERTADTEHAIGCFGNTVLLRARVAPHDTFTDLVARTRDATISDVDHGDASARLSFALREPDGRGFCPPGVSCERTALRGLTAQLPLGLSVDLAPHGAAVEAGYLSEVLDEPIVRRMLMYLEQLLKNALQQPDTPLYMLDILGADAVWLDTVSRGESVDAAPTTLGEIVERRVGASPDAVAVTYEGLDFTYRQLNERANRFAHWLIRQGIGTEDAVAVVMERSPQLVIAALGIAKAGAVYLPIDPDYSADRVALILSDSAPRLVVRDPIDTLEGYRTDNPSDSDRVRPLRADNLAYIIYTSGSTGTPKGVPVAHAPIAEYLTWFGRDYQADGCESVLQLASTSFDASIEEIFGTLGHGARLVIPRRNGLRDVGYLTRLLERENITAMHLVPSLLGLFLSLPGVTLWRTLRRIPIGGEALPGELADRFHNVFDARLSNFYGPTETTIASTRYRVVGKQGNRIVPIGSPKDNTIICLLDSMLRPVPVGAIGEIYIGGTCLARGYLGRPGLTAERFVADPYGSGGRLYRTGDLARRNTSGDLEFVGRADEQAKVGGLRIALGEVAAAASVDPSVGQCAVVVRDLPATGRTLVAYMTPAAGHDTVDVDRVRTRVSAALPDYMTPAAFVVLDEIPITTHGKFDRDALPEPELENGGPRPVASNR